MSLVGLLPCPLCGARTIAVMWVDWSYRAVCSTKRPAWLAKMYPEEVEGAGCGAYGPPFDSEGQAADAWNRRAP